MKMSNLLKIIHKRVHVWHKGKKKTVKKKKKGILKDRTIQDYYIQLIQTVFFFFVLLK